MPTHEPTADELRAAYQTTRLWVTGITLAYAMTHQTFRACLRGIAINARRQAERSVVEEKPPGDPERKVVDRKHGPSVLHAARGFARRRNRASGAPRKARSGASQLQACRRRRFFPRMGCILAESC